jgi:hypothetical protein
VVSTGAEGRVGIPDAVSLRALEGLAVEYYLC